MLVEKGFVSISVIIHLYLFFQVLPSFFWGGVTFHSVSECETVLLRSELCKVIREDMIVQ